MSAILDFFTSLIDIIISLLQLVITLVDSILWLIANLPQLIAGITTSFAYAPSFIMPFLSASLAILIVIMLIRLL